MRIVYPIPSRRCGVIGIGPANLQRPAVEDDDPTAAETPRAFSLRRENLCVAKRLRSLSVPEAVLGPAAHRAVHMLNHLEYDNRSLADEYERDLKAGLATSVPVNLFPGDDPARGPENRWRGHGHLLFQNWINEIYQTTYFDLTRIGAAR